VADSSAGNVLAVRYNSLPSAAGRYVVTLEVPVERWTARVACVACVARKRSGWTRTAAAVNPAGRHPLVKLNGWIGRASDGNLGEWLVVDGRHGLVEIEAVEEKMREAVVEDTRQCCSFAKLAVRSRSGYECAVVGLDEAAAGFGSWTGETLDWGGWPL
jgi:hypothetical protein